VVDARTSKVNADSVLVVRLSHQPSKDFSLDVEFDAPAGFTMLLGPSGGGKTTILNCIAGLTRPDSGRIAVASRVLFDSARGIDLPVAERRLGYLFQNVALFPHLTIEENVQYGIMKLPAQERRKRMMVLLDSFRISHLLGSKPNEISGGERQRAALAGRW
jgi:molybdate transport system ATP-binding protein